MARSGDSQVARDVRREVDSAGGSLTLPVRDLRNAFGRATLTRSARSEITEALRGVGLAADPPLDVVRLDDRVRLIALDSARPPSRTEAAPAMSAGWYADPDDARLIRYWDGSAWTHHTRRATPEVRTFPPAAPQPNLWRRFRAWPAWAQWAAALAAVVVLIAALSGDEGTDERADDPQPAQQAAAPPADDESAEEARARDRERARERKRARAKRRARKRAKERERRRERRLEEARERRERERAARPPPAEEPEDEPAEDCDPNYGGGCVPPFPPDVDCPDIGGPYTVTGSDPHGLDRDGDGEACEAN